MIPRSIHEEALTVMHTPNRASQVAPVLKNPPVNSGDIRDIRDRRHKIPVSGGSAGGGHGNPLQYSCLENPMDRGAWWATESQTRLKQVSMHAYTNKSPKIYEANIDRIEGRNKQLYTNGDFNTLISIMEGTSYTVSKN